MEKFKTFGSNYMVVTCLQPGLARQQVSYRCFSDGSNYMVVTCLPARTEQVSYKCFSDGSNYMVVTCLQPGLNR